MFKLDELFLNPQIRTHSGTVPGTFRNTYVGTRNQMRIVSRMILILKWEPPCVKPIIQFTQTQTKLFTAIQKLSNILRHFNIMGAKFSSQMCCFCCFFTWCLQTAFTPTSAFLFMSDRKILFSPICSISTVERNWNRKNSQNVQNLGFFWKYRQVFRKKNFEIFRKRYMWQIFSRMRLSWYFFLKKSFHLISEVFLVKIRKR